MRVEDKGGWNEEMRELDIRKGEVENMELKVWYEAEPGWVKAGQQEWVAKQRALGFEGIREICNWIIELIVHKRRNVRSQSGLG